MTTVQTLKDIFNQNKDKCIAVVGTTCVDKTTLMKDIIDDDLLKKRTEKRSASFADAKAMQRWIEGKVKKSKLPVKILNIT